MKRKRTLSPLLLAEATRRSSKVIAIAMQCATSSARGWRARSFSSRGRRKTSLLLRLRSDRRVKLSVVREGRLEEVMFLFGRQFAGNLRRCLRLLVKLVHADSIEIAIFGRGVDRAALDFTFRCDRRLHTGEFVFSREVGQREMIAERLLVDLGIAQQHGGVRAVLPRVRIREVLRLAVDRNLAFRRSGFGGGDERKQHDQENENS